MSVVKTNSLQLGQSLTATNNFTWYQPSTPDGTVRLGNGNSGSVTDLVTLTSAGNLGIGTSSPSYKIDASGSIRANVASYNQFIATRSSQSWVMGIDASSNWVVRDETGGDTKLYLSASGNLGLGVTPSGWYTATNNVALQFGTGSIACKNSGTLLNQNGYTSTAGGGWKYIGNDYATSYAQTSGQHQWFTAPSGTAGNAISFTQAMTLDASGRLYVGTTTQASGYDMKLVLSNDSGTNNWSVGPRVAVPGAFYVAANTTYGVYLSSPTVTAWASASDERLKTDLKPIENATQKVLSLRAVTGRFKTDEESVSRAFLIAQDVQAVLPEAVDSEDPEKLGVRYTETIPLLVAAIKELTAQVSDLKTELNELKQKVNA